MATRSISTKLELDGEKEYRESLKAINSDLGVLKSELKLTESQFAGQANSYEALEAKGKTLAAMYEQQETRLQAVNAMIKTAQEAQQKYAEKVEATKAAISQTEAALEALAGAQGDTAEEQKRLTEELKRQKEELAASETLHQKAALAVNKYQTQANGTKTELNRLGAEIQKNSEYLNEAAKSSDGCATSIDQYGKETKQAAEETDKLADKLKNGLASGAKAAVTAIASIGAATAAGVKALLDLADSTEEYRTAQGKLNTAYEAAGYSTETAQEAYRSLFAVLGDTDTATEAAQLLAQLATSEEDVAAWADIAAGVTGTFGDALPINSLIEAANETAKVGQVTGTLADALNWVGISEDEFNAKLAACRDETERTALITETLSAQYQEAADIFRENNESIMAARDAQAEMDDALSHLGSTVSDVKTKLTAEFLPAIAGVVDAFAAVLEGEDGAEEALTDAIDELIQQVNEKLPEFLDFGVDIILNLLSGLVKGAPELVSGAIGAVNTLVEGLLEALPEVTEAAIQIIIALANGISEALPTLIPAAIEAIVQICEVLTNPDNLSGLIDAAIEIILALVDGLMEALPTLIAAVPDILANLITAIIVNAPKLIEAGISLVMSLADGLIKALPELIAALPNLIIGIVEGLLDHLDEIITAGLEITMALIEGLIKAIPDIIMAIPKIITSIVETLLEFDWAEVGINIVEGIWNGFVQMWNDFKDTVSEAVNGIIDEVKDILGIASPSKVFAGIGGYMAEGLGQGFEAGFTGVRQDMTGSIVEAVEGELAAANTALADGMDDIDTGFTARTAIREVTAAIPARLTAQTQNTPRGAGIDSGYTQRRNYSGRTTTNNYYTVNGANAKSVAQIEKQAQSARQTNRSYGGA